MLQITLLAIALAILIAVIVWPFEPARVDRGGFRP